MDLKGLKKYISEDNSRIEKVLSYFGFHSFNYPKEGEIRCALPDGDNPTSCSIFTDENLYGVVFSRANFKGDIFSIISEFSGRKQKDVFSLVGTLMGFSNSKPREVKSNATIDLLKKYRKRKTSEPKGNKLYNENILMDYVMLPTVDVIQEGISPKVIKQFNIGYSLKDERIIFPHYDWIETDKIVGIQGRITGIDDHVAKSLGVPKYWNFINGYKKHLNLYGYAQNKDNIKEQKMMIIYEGEKSVLKQASFTDGKGIGVAVGGHSLSMQQIKFIVNNTDVDTEIVIAYDNDIWHNKSEVEMLMKSIEPLQKFRKVSFCYDVFNKLLGEKDSPVDKGYTVYKVLLEYRKPAEEGVIDFG